MPNSAEIQSSSSPGFDWNAAGQSAVQSGGNLLGSVVNGLFNMAEAKKQRDWSEQMMDKQNAFSVDMWNKTNAYNSPAMQKQRLIDAGLNPLYYGLDGTSAESFESAQPLGYERAQAPSGLMNLGSDAMQAYRAAQMQEAQIDNINADTARKKADTEGIQLANQFAKDTLQDREEGVALANQLTKQQIDNAKQEFDKLGKEIDLLIKQAATEEERKFLVMSEKALNYAKIKEIAELLPLKKGLMKAQTIHEKAMAALCFAQAAYQNGLIEEGYITAITDEVRERARKEGNEADLIQDNEALKALELAVRNGQPNDIAKWFDEHKWAKAAMPGMSFFSGDLFKVFSDIDMACGRILGPVLGFAAGAKVATGAAKKTSTKYTNLYGPDGKPMSTTSWSQ